MSVNITGIVDEKYEFSEPMTINSDDHIVVEATLKAPTPAHRELIHLSRQMLFNMTLAVEKLSGDGDDDNAPKEEPTEEERKASFLMMTSTLEYSDINHWYDVAVKSDAITIMGGSFKLVLDKLPENDFYGILAEYFTAFIMR